MYKIYVAIDTPHYQIAYHLAKELVPYCGLKIGLEFFCSHGPEGIKKLHEETGCGVFLDLKFLDIPNTVYGAIKAIAPYSFIDAISVHASGSNEMLEMAVTAADEVDYEYGSRPAIWGVTVLTSDKLDVFSSLALADKITKAGLDGVICSPWTAGLISKVIGNDFDIVCPGIRKQHNSTDDHFRAATPRDAKEAGATTIIVGRPITYAANPYQELLSFLKEFDGD